MGWVAIALVGVPAIAPLPSQGQERIETRGDAAETGIAPLTKLDPVPTRPHAAWLRTALAPRRDEEALEAGLARARAWTESEDRSADAWYWVAVLSALRAENGGARAKISLGQEAFLAADSALKLDDTHAGAHHVMGRLHAGVLRLGRVTRWVGRQLGLGDLMEQATWESAEFHMRRAHELAPAELSYTLEYASLLASRGREEEATSLVEIVRRAPTADAWDEMTRARACSEWPELGPEGCPFPN